ncbi:MAG: OmpA family protein [Lysobacter sp.]|nr:OmpA family protein [Lysobacter sp.]
MTTHRILPLTLIAAAVLAGCSSLPANNSLLDEARADYGNAQASPKVTALAAGELRQAGNTLDRANAAWSKDEDEKLVNHLAYVTKQEVAIARETADQKAAELSMTTAAAERDAVRLDARTREAERAQRSAQYSQRQAEASQRQSEASQRSAELSRRESDASQRSAELSRRESDVARMNAEAAQRQAGAERQAANVALLNAQDARQQTEEARRRSRELEAQLVALEARKTDRGMVVTLGDVLFDTDEAQLKAGGVRNVQKLADFFKEHPQRNVMIEGFTDSTGTGDHNQRLSDRRADSVRTALLGMGMNSDRITWRGYGESYPVAGNDTAAGRQMNRRVELVVSDDNGTIAPR